MCLIVMLSWSQASEAAMRVLRSHAAATRARRPAVEVEEVEDEDAGVRTNAGPAAEAPGGAAPYQDAAWPAEVAEEMDENGLYAYQRLGERFEQELVAIGEQSPSFLASAEPIDG